ncbi:MAG: ribonuclease Z [Candidatus Nanoarchaeia archaeon]|nr:ribonuclease Z [Candidatus Nanoarchaeia archaeon]MDD5741223.1 ribonuclease Z [Candidatus Nanoarchaeia archaeon]
MKIPITFLGTSQAIPTEKRNHTAVLLKYKDETILIDCGEGTQRQFRRAHLNPCKITRILITHWHGDHVLGLPGLFQTLVLNNYNKTMKIYGPRGTKKFLKEFVNIFIPVLKFKAEVHEVTGKFLETSDFEITARSLDHGNAPTNGYEFKEKSKLRINKEKLKKLKLTREETVKLSELIKGKNLKINNKLIKSKDLTYEQKGKRISFILDTKICKNAKKLAKKSDLAIIESTYLDTEKDLARDYGHLTAKQAAQIAKQSKVKQLILTHISQRYENNEPAILHEAKKIFPNTILAEDLMRVEV